nr:FixH family protein [uncultured Gellertiella sp.]
MSTDTSKSEAAPSGFVFTGRHMWLVMILFFGTVIGVNVTMAWFAHSSWSGLVVENGYVASQEFNAKAALARAIAASGVKGVVEVRGDVIHYTLKDARSVPVIADRVTLNFRRPVGDHQDFTLPLQDTGNGLFVGNHPVAAGQWIVETEALRGKDIVMHEAVRILVDGGK